MHSTSHARHTAWQKIILSAACLVLGAMTAARATVPEFVLAKDGRAQAVIVPYGGDTNGLAFAANELAEFLGRLSGATFMVADKPVPGYRTLLVGAPYQPSEEQEICIRVKDAGTLEVTGDGQLGALYAAYDLLETLGCVFVAHDYTYTPTTNLLAIAGDYVKIDAPWMKLRDIWTELESHVSYMMRLRLQGASNNPIWNRFGGKRVYAIKHSIGGLWFRDRELRKQHPEWFAYLRKGDRRSFGWVCVSNEEMYQQLFKEIAAYLEKNPGIPEVSVAIGDCSDFCECPKCLDLVEKYRDAGGEDVFACQYLILANRVAERFAGEYPGVRFNILAYGERQPSGNNITMAPNVGAFVAELWRNHGLPADCNPRGAYCMQHIAAISPRENPPYVWDYQANFRDFLIPFPNLRIFAQSARYYKRLGIRAIMTQNQYSKIGDLSEMKLWLYAKLTWNPDADQERLIDTYLDAAYGNGARHVREYINLVEHARLRQSWTWYGCYVNDTSHYLTDEDCVRIWRALESAVSSTRRDRPRNILCRRARVAALAMAVWRYNDMIAPAQRLKIKLPARDDLFAQLAESHNDTGVNFAPAMIGENVGFSRYRQRYAMIATNAPAATTFPTNDAVVRITPAQMTGGRRFRVVRDTNGVEHARIHVTLHKEEELQWMNPGFAEIGYTIPAGLEGDWYVFATLRSGATAALDPTGAYFGIYTPWFSNGIDMRARGEIANYPIATRKAENGMWRTVCLGKRRLFPGARLWVMPGILKEAEYIDVREFRLVPPALFEKSTPAADAAKDAGDGQSAKPRSIVVGWRAFDRAPSVRIQDDRIDNFKYARLAPFDTNAPVAAVTWTVKPAEAGEWELFAKVRIGAAFALDYDAATLTVTPPAQKQADGGDVAVQPAARVLVTGCEGDESWQTVGLGRLTLEPGMRLSLAPRGGTNGVPHYVDMQSVILLNPL